MPDHRKLILLSVVILAAWFFLEELVFAYFPEKIPETPINFRGLWIILGLYLMFLFLFKKIIKEHPRLSIGYLSILGALIGVLSEVIFQFYRQFTFIDIEPAGRMMLFFRGVLGIGVIAAIMALSVGLDVLYKKPWLSWIVTVSLLAVMRYGLIYFDLL